MKLTKPCWSAELMLNFWDEVVWFCLDIKKKKKEEIMLSKHTYYILSMLLCINGGVLICLEYPSKHSKLHQGLDYIVYLWCCIDFDCINFESSVQLFSF